MGAVREYKQERIPVDLITRIIEAARLSAGSMTGQPWHVVVVSTEMFGQRLTAT